LDQSSFQAGANSVVCFDQVSQGLRNPRLNEVLARQVMMRVPLVGITEAKPSDERSIVRMHADLP